MIADGRLKAGNFDNVKSEREMQCNVLADLKADESRSKAAAYFKKVIPSSII